MSSWTNHPSSSAASKRTAADFSQGTGSMFSLNNVASIEGLSPDGCCFAKRTGPGWKAAVALDPRSQGVNDSTTLHSCKSTSLARIVQESTLLGEHNGHRCLEIEESVIPSIRPCGPSAGTNLEPSCLGSHSLCNGIPTVF